MCKGIAGGDSAAGKALALLLKIISLFG